MLLWRRTIGQRSCISEFLISLHDMTAVLSLPRECRSREDGCSTRCPRAPRDPTSGKNWAARHVSNRPTSIWARCWDIASTGDVLVVDMGGAAVSTFGALAARAVAARSIEGPSSTAVAGTSQTSTRPTSESAVDTWLRRRQRSGPISRPTDSEPVPSTLRPARSRPEHRRGASRSGSPRTLS